MIKVGQKVRFDPFHGIKACGVADVAGKVEGTVVYVHPEHRYFTAEYEAADKKFKISFNFNDLYGEKRNVFMVRD